MSDFLKQSGIDESFYKNQVGIFLLSFYRQSTEYQKKKIFLDKTPRYFHVVFELIELFPEAKFIILFRNPLAVLNSIIKTWVKDDLSLLAEYRDDLLVAPLKMVECLRLSPHQCFKVRYEDIVTDPDTFTKEICQFLNISYSNDLLDYTNRRNPQWRFLDPIGIQQSNRPTHHSLSHWEKNFITPQDKLLAMSYLQALSPDLVKEMGYDYDKMSASIDYLPEELKKNSIFWSTLMSEEIGFSKTKQVRNLLLKVFSNEKIWRSGTNNVDNNTDDSAWRDIIQYATKRLMEGKLHSSIQERNQMKKELDAMRSSLSWKITAPARMIKKAFRKEDG